MPLIKIVNWDNTDWYNGEAGLLLNAWDIPGTDEWGICLSMTLNPPTLPIKAEREFEMVNIYMTVKKEHSMVWQK